MSAHQRHVDPNFRLLMKACYILADEKQSRAVASHRSQAQDGVPRRTDAELDALILKYVGYEEELFQTVCSKYELDPNAVIASLVEAQRQHRSAGAPASSADISHLDRKSQASKKETTEEDGYYRSHRHTGTRESLYQDVHEGNVRSSVTSAEQKVDVGAVLELVETHRLYDEARRRVASQQLEITNLITERRERQAKEEKLADLRQEEVSIMTHTATALRIELARLEGGLLHAGSHSSGSSRGSCRSWYEGAENVAGTRNISASSSFNSFFHQQQSAGKSTGCSGSYVPVSALFELSEANAAITVRLAEAMRLRRLVEQGLGEQITKDPSGPIANEIKRLDPSLAIRHGATL